MQRKGFTRFQNGNSLEMVIINVRVEGSTWVLAGLLSGQLNTYVWVSMAVLVESGIWVYRVAVAVATAVEASDLTTNM